MFEHQESVSIKESTPLNNQESFQSYITGINSLNSAAKAENNSADNLLPGLTITKSADNHDSKLTCKNPGAVNSFSLEGPQQAEIKSKEWLHERFKNPNTSEQNSNRGGNLRQSDGARVEKPSLNGSDVSTDPLDWITSEQEIIKKKFEQAHKNKDQDGNSESGAEKKLKVPDGAMSKEDSIKAEQEWIKKKFDDARGYSENRR